MVRRPSTPPLFPYTTLFRSGRPRDRQSFFRPSAHHEGERRARGRTVEGGAREAHPWARDVLRLPLRRVHAGEIGRAHAELQSHVNLVCRLLLEKKKHAVKTY